MENILIIKACLLKIYILITKIIQKILHNIWNLKFIQSKCIKNKENKLLKISKYLRKIAKKSKTSPKLCINEFYYSQIQDADQLTIKSENIIK